jgi:hypothetical protein
MEAACSLSRNFSFDGAVTLLIGMPISFTAGFYNWVNPDAKTKAVAWGVSPTMYYSIIEGSASLAGMTFAALVTLSF